MGRLFTCGFELNSGTTGVELDYFGGGAQSINAVTVRSGSYSAKFLANNSYGTASIRPIACAAGRTYYYRAYLRIKTSLSAAAPIMDGFSSSADWFVKLNTNDTLQLTDGAGTNIGSASSALSKDTWYRIEVSYVFNSGACTARINGVQFASGSATASRATSWFEVGIGTNSVAIVSGEIYFDDLAVNDDQGSYQNSWPGSGKVIILRPNAAGGQAEWTRGGTDSGANWSQCNNIPPNDVTSYVYASTVNIADSYNCNDSGIGGADTVNVVEVGGRFCRSAATSPTFAFRLVKVGGGTIVLSANITPDSATWRTNANAVPRTSPIILYLDPDGAPWTQATLDTMQIGVKETVDTTRYVWISEVWAMVDYTPSTTVTGTGAGTLTAITGTGTGAHGVAGTGAGAAAAITGSASGWVSVSGTGAGSLSPLTGSGTGARGEAGTGAGTTAALTGSGAGAHGVSGSASGGITPLYGSAQGAFLVSGPAAADVAPLTGQASGAHGVAGSGAGQTSEIFAAASGAHGVAGTAEGNLTPVSGQASGWFLVRGQAAGTISQPFGEATGAHGVAGVGAGQVTPVYGEATGHVEEAEGEVTGVGEGIITPLIGLATGAHGVAGMAAGVLPVLVADGYGLTGTGEPSIRRLKVAGEIRTLQLPGESRVLLLEGENRFLKVTREDRILSVEAEERTLRMAA